MNVKWTENARFERLELIRYITIKNPKAARRIHKSIKDSVDELAIFPYKGRVGRIPGTRELIILSKY